MHPPQSATRPTLGAIILLGALSALGAISIDLYLPSLPSIGRVLGADAAQVQYTMSAFFVGMAVGQIVLGPLSDRFGRRPVILAGIMVFVAASLGCAVAPTIGWLVTGRFVQAIGACAGQVVARAVVRDRYDHQESARIFSLMALVLGVAPMIAPTVGAWLATFVSWRAIFVVLAVIGTVIGAVVALRLEESRSAATALQARHESVVGSFAALLHHSRLVGYLLAGALNGATVFIYVASAPDLLITQFGFTPPQFAFAFAIMAVGVIGSSQVNRGLLGRYAADTILAVSSLGGVVAGLLLLAAALTGVGGYWSILVLLFVCLASYGVNASNCTAGALGVDPLRAGATSALIGAASFGVGAIGASVVGVLHDGTPLPLAGVLAVALGSSAVALHWLALPRTAAEIDP